MKMLSAAILLASLVASQLVAQVDRTKPPALGPAPALHLPAMHAVTLPNGLTLAVVEMHKVPVVEVQVLVDAGAADILQPSVTKVGGISEERRIAWMAEENGIRFIPHGWNTAVGLAADLHLASASRDTDMVEYLTGSPFIDDIVENKWQLDDNGMLVVPNGPGLGISLNLDAVEKYTGQRFSSS